MRTIVIGDVHGCLEEVQDLLDACTATDADRIIFAGDLVDRGPKPRECVELAMKHEAILGNHEEKHLNQRRSADAKLSPDHLRTRRALTDAHYDWFDRLPLFIELPECGATVVHAGAMPGIPIAKQEPYHLLHAQCIKPPARKSYWPSKAPGDHTFWTNHWKGPERVIFGHTVLDKPLVSDHAVGIDTGCCHGRTLTAVILPSWEIVSVPSRQPLDPYRKVGKIKVQDDGPASPEICQNSVRAEIVIAADDAVVVAALVLHVGRRCSRKNTNDSSKKAKGDARVQEVEELVEEHRGLLLEF